MNYSKLLGLGFILSILIMTFITPQPAQAVAYTINPANHGKLRYGARKRGRPQWVYRICTWTSWRTCGCG